MKTMAFVFAVLLAISLAFLFFAKIWIAYDATATGSMKAVGYFFIILYSILFCGCLLGVFIPILLMVAWREAGPRIDLLVIAIVCASVAASMLFHYRRALFYFHPTPNQAMQLTATRTAFTVYMTKTFPPHLTLGVSSRS